MDNQDLGRYQDMMPSRAVLARLSIFGTSEETRASANAILKALPPMNEKERREYLDETWRLADLPSEEGFAAKSNWPRHFGNAQEQRTDEWRDPCFGDGGAGKAAFHA